MKESKSKDPSMKEWKKRRKSVDINTKWTEEEDVDRVVDKDLSSRKMISINQYILFVCCSSLGRISQRGRVNKEGGQSNQWDGKRPNEKRKNVNRVPRLPRASFCARSSWPPLRRCALLIGWGIRGCRDRRRVAPLRLHCSPFRGPRSWCNGGRPALGTRTACREDGPISLFTFSISLIGFLRLRFQIKR